MESTLDKMYRRLVKESGPRECTGISESACADAARNFSLLAAANALMRMGDELGNARTTLPWLMSSAGAPAFLFAFLVPLREAGSMLPQVLLAPFLNRFARRRGFWVGGALVQGLCVLAMPAALLLDSGLAAGLLVLALLAVFSLARSLCSISFKDVAGKTVPKKRRGRLTGTAAALAGAFVMMVGLALALLAGDQPGPLVLSLLLAGAASLWGLAAGFFWFVREPAGQAEIVRGIFRNAGRDMALLKSRRDLRDLVLARTFLLFPTLAAPYFVLLASRGGGEAGILGLFILAGGIAGILSAPWWGRCADRSSRLCLAAAGLLACSVGPLLFLLVALTGVAGLPLWAYPILFFLLHVAHGGMRIGRKTWVVDAAEGSLRTRYVSVSNTAIGLVLLAAGLSGLLAAVWPLERVILVLSLAGLPGVAAAWRLREVE